MCARAAERVKGYFGYFQRPTDFRLQDTPGSASHSGHILDAGE
jgi:hypothetical protein